jgi:RNA polymerase sigma factor
MGLKIKLFQKMNMEEKLKIVKHDLDLRNKFIESYFPWIIKTITRITGKYVEVENDVYLSIALEGFNYAIDSYDADKGKFLSYAGIIIKNRIVDGIRIEKRMSNRFDSLDKKIENNIHIQELVDGSADSIDQQMIKYEEIKLFKMKLAENKITIEQLAESSPKHRDTRQNCYKVADTLQNDTTCRTALWEKAQFLRKRLSKIAEVSEKMLKANRRFIIATAIIWIGKLHFLGGFIELNGGEMDA